MKAVVWHDVGDIRLDDVEEPKIQSRPTRSFVGSGSNWGDAVHSPYGYDSAYVPPLRQRKLGLIRLGGHLKIVGWRFPERSYSGATSETTDRSLPSESGWVVDQTREMR